MTRKEEMWQAALVANGVKNPDDFVRGAEWADKAMITKACDWLNNFYSEDRHCFLVKEDIDAFKQAMEKGEIV